MKVEIKNMLGIEHKEIEFRAGIPHAIIGKNATGKTSVTAIIAALAAQNSNPFSVNVSMARGYIHRGAREGYAMMAMVDGDVRWSSGTAIKGFIDAIATDESVGLVDLVAARSPAKTRIAAWEKILGITDISPDILDQYFEGRDQRELAAVKETISRDGWGSAVAIYVEHRREQKRVWKRIVGDGKEYSVKDAAQWTPAGWLPENETSSVDVLEGELASARELLAAARSHEAVSESQITDGVAAKKEIKQHEARVEEIITAKDQIREGYRAECEIVDARLNDVSHMESEVREARATISRGEFVTDAKNKTAKFDSLRVKKDHFLRQIEVLEAKTREDVDPITCPECSAKLLVLEGEVKKWDENATKLLAKEIKAKTTGLNKVSKDMDQMKADNAAEGKEMLVRLEGELRGNQAVDTSKRDKLHKEGTALKKEEDEIGIKIFQLLKTAEYADKIAGSEDPENIARLTTAVIDKEQQIVDFKQWKEARAAHDAVCANDHIVKVLEPGGAKDVYVKARFGMIEKYLSNVIGAAGWPPITIDSEYGITIDGTAAAFASKSECWRAQVGLQIAVALYSNSKMLVFDECDILDSVGYSGLIEALTRLSSKFKDNYFVFAGTELGDIPESFDQTEL